MDITAREISVAFHGLFLGALFVFASGAALAGMRSFRPGLTTAQGIQDRVSRLKLTVGAMAGLAWAMVLTGTWVVYPWYRDKRAGAEFEKCQGLELPSTVCSSRDFLLSNVAGTTEKWHAFGMEWKEHVAWGAPLLATSAFVLVLYYGPRIMARPWLRGAVMVLVVSAFAAVAIAGVLGALISKVAPISPIL